MCREIDQQWADQTWTYAVLYDARGLTAAVPLNELQRLAAHIDGVGLGQPRGPVGIFIAARAEMLRSGIEYAASPGRARDVEALLNQVQANAWRARHAIRRVD